MVEVGVQISYTEGCCGVKQLCDFSDPLDDDYHDWSIGASGDTLEEAYANLFAEFYGNRTKWFGPHEYTCAVCQMWFVKERDFADNFNDDFVAESLRLLVAGIPGVIELGEYRNPNSGNIIRGYQWSVN